MATVENIIERAAQDIYKMAMQTIEDETGVCLQRLCELAKAETNGEIAPVIHAHYDGCCCSNCGWPIATDCWGGGMDENNYCYHCGAKMDLTGDDA